ncbi:MAG: mechanosensitive ion channel [Myxococcota bacterium]|nr:mechanosensitive ion channel [Myxococcota bacterium]
MDKLSEFQPVLLTLLVILLYIGGRPWLSKIFLGRIDDPRKKFAGQKTIHYSLTVLAVLALIHIWLGGFTGVFAYIGIVSAGLAIAMQDPLMNLAGWIFIATRKPFSVGDRIEIDGHAGDVVDLRPFQFSLIEIGNWVGADQTTGRIVHIPNGMVFKQVLVNATQEFDYIWDEIPVMVTFESDWRRCKEILLEVARGYSSTLSSNVEEQMQRASRKFLLRQESMDASVWTDCADSGVVLILRYFVDARQRRKTKTTIWEGIFTAFEQENHIDFAYPTVRYFDNRHEGKAPRSSEA